MPLKISKKEETNLQYKKNACVYLSPLSFPAICDECKPVKIMVCHSYPVATIYIRFFTMLVSERHHHMM